MISKSSAEVEYRVVTYTVAETIWIQKLPIDVGIVLSTPTHVIHDNINATEINANPSHHDCSKQIVVNYYLARGRTPLMMLYCIMSYN